MLFMPMLLYAAIRAMPMLSSNMPSPCWMAQQERYAPLLPARRAASAFTRYADDVFRHYALLTPPTNIDTAEAHMSCRHTFYYSDVLRCHYYMLLTPPDCYVRAAVIISLCRFISAAAAKMPLAAYAAYAAMPCCHV